MQMAPFVLGFIWMGLMRVFAGPLVWGTLLLANLMSLALAVLLFLKVIPSDPKQKNSLAPPAVGVADVCATRIVAIRLAERLDTTPRSQARIPIQDASAGIASAVRALTGNSLACLPCPGRGTASVAGGNLPQNLPPFHVYCVLLLLACCH